MEKNKHDTFTRDGNKLLLFYSTEPELGLSIWKNLYLEKENEYARYALTTKIDFIELQGLKK